MAEDGWKPHRDLLARKSLSPASIHGYLREKQRGMGISVCLSSWRKMVGNLIELLLAQRKLSPASSYLYLRDKQRGTISSNPRFQTFTTGVCEKKTRTSGEEYTLEHKLSEHQIRGWIAVSAVGLQGEGLRRRSVFSQTPVLNYEK